MLLYYRHCSASFENACKDSKLNVHGSKCYIVVVALLQISAEVAWDCASCWSSPGSAGQEQEWVAARMAEMGSSSCIKPASTPSLIWSA